MHAGFIRCPAGNVWVADNWQTPDACWNSAFSEAQSTQRGGNGLTVFYRMAKRARTADRAGARTVALQAW